MTRKVIVSRIIAQPFFQTGGKSLRTMLVIAGALVVAQGCATTSEPPPKTPPIAAQAPAAEPPDAGTPPAELIPPLDQTTAQPQGCQCPGATTAKPAEPVAPIEQRSRFSAVDWKDLPDWGLDPLAPSFIALLQSCNALGGESAWKTVCTEANRLTVQSPNRKLREFFETNFTPHQVINPDGAVTGMITGYYEPLLYGSRTRSEQYRYPLYSQPDDLITVDLSSIHPDLKNKRLRGRLEGNRVVPYYTRSEIETNEPPIRGKELVWVNNPVDVVFLHIQGSGQVRLDTGEIMRVGYADQNGHPFRSVGRYLIQQRILRPEQVSMQGIKAWAQKNPDKADALLNYNPSYVFFRELPLNLPGPIGTLGVPLTAERSIAVDQRSIPLGVPVYLATTWPNSSKPLNRLMVAQDTGGAINGAVRADFFWGFGDDAGKLAGVMKQSGRMWVLLPKGYTPPGS
ncbi:MAG TPA: murein transglycosylase A [Burkholderiales bacterium]|nr:murein transglycosylase A [Burkholderiales bacterium]